MYLRTGILTGLLVFSVTTVVQSQPTTDKKLKERTEYETELQKLKQDIKGLCEGVVAKEIYMTLSDGFKVYWANFAFVSLAQGH